LSAEQRCPTTLASSFAENQKARMKNQVSPKELQRAWEYYGFAEEPFNLKPDPKFLFLAPSHWEAFYNMMAGVNERKGVIVVCGDVGIGKTILIYALLKDLDEKVKTSFVYQTKLSFEDILKNLLIDLEGPLFKEEGLVSLIFHLKNFLKQSIRREDNVAVVIDEAQSLDEAVLGDLLNIASTDVPGATPLQILLVGHPELEEKLNSDRLRLVKKNIGVVSRIKPLNREEIWEYLKHRANVAGGNAAQVFSIEAIKYIRKFSGGNPRLINILCTQALLVGCLSSSPVINKKIIRQSTKDLDHFILPKNQRPSFMLFFLLFSGMVFLFSLTFLIINLLRR
jgi:general secretion pathway protein A